MSDTSITEQKQPAPTTPTHAGPFPTPATAFRWLFGRRDRAASPPALDPARELIDGGGGDGTRVIRGMVVDVLDLEARLLLCVAQLDRTWAPAATRAGFPAVLGRCATERLLRWAYVDGHSDVKAELTGSDARTLDAVLRPVERDARAWMREHGVLRRDE